MGLILCATRGGEASLRTQNAAIALAKERGDELAFLYIVDLEFLNKTAAPIMVDVENELAELGNFLLLVAKERANEQGVTTCQHLRFVVNLVPDAGEMPGHDHAIRRAA